MRRKFHLFVSSVVSSALLLAAIAVPRSETTAGSSLDSDQAAGSPCSRRPIVVTRATLWTAAGTIRNAEVVFANGRVAVVGRPGAVARPVGARVIDARGDTLLPGLIDAHAHLVFPGGAPREIREDPLRPEISITGRQLLRSGVTAARIHLWDLVDGPAFRRRAEDDCFPAPRLETGGPGFIGGAPDLVRQIVWGVKDAEDARRKIEQTRDSGARWIALHELGRFAPGQIETLVAEARRAGLRVMAAGEDPTAIRLALAVGVDSIEYLDRSTAEPYSAELLALMKKRRSNLFWVPPIGYYRRYVEYRRDAALLDLPILTEFMPEALGRHLLDDLRAQRTRPHSPSGESIDRASPGLPTKFRQMREAGLNVVVGTDCGSPANFQSDAIWWELETWRRYGAAPADIIRAATTAGAALLQMSDVGAIKVGARADFLIYRGSVGAGNFDVGRLRYVAKGGVLFVADGRWIGP